MSLDFPRAWQIAGQTDSAYHHNDCSYNKTSGALLCDCNIINKHPEMLDKSILYTTDGKISKRV